MIFHCTLSKRFFIVRAFLSVLSSFEEMLLLPQKFHVICVVTVAHVLFSELFLTSFRLSRQIMII